MSLIIVGLAMIIYEKYLFKEDIINKDKNIINFFESYIFATTIKDNGKLFFMVGVINLLLKNTIFELYGFILSMIVCLVFLISYIKGFAKYIKQ